MTSYAATQEAGASLLWIAVMFMLCCVLLMAAIEWAVNGGVRDFVRWIKRGRRQLWQRIQRLHQMY